MQSTASADVMVSRGSFVPRGNDSLNILCGPLHSISVDDVRWHHLLHLWASLVQT